MQGFSSERVQFDSLVVLFFVGFHADSSLKLSQSLGGNWQLTWHLQYYIIFNIISSNIKYRLDFIWLMAIHGNKSQHDRCVVWISPCNHAEVELLQLGVQEVEIVAPAVTNLENPLNKDTVDVDVFPDIFFWYFRKKITCKHHRNVVFLFSELRLEYGNKGW